MLTTNPEHFIHCMRLELETDAVNICFNRTINRNALSVQRYIQLFLVNHILQFNVIIKKQAHSLNYYFTSSIDSEVASISADPIRLTAHLDF